MKKRIVAILSLIMIFAIAINLNVNAADATASLTASSREVNPGDTFTVTFSESCEDGINGTTTTISYDEEKLELVDSIKIIDSEKWANLGEGLKAEIIHLSSDTITTSDIFKLTFKVKDNAERGTTATVTASNVFIDSDAAENSTHELGTKTVEIHIKEETSSGSQEGSATVNNITTDNTTKYENIAEKNATQSQEKTMPNTGTNLFIGTVTVIIVTGVIGSYISYKKYKDV